MWRVGLVPDMGNTSCLMAFEGARTASQLHLSPHPYKSVQIRVGIYPVKALIGRTLLSRALMASAILVNPAC